VRAWLVSRAQLQSKPPEFQERLQVMRWVMEHEQEADTTALQRTCRRWLEKDFKGFVRNLERLEREADR
jgi:hypothetical protein